MTISFSDYFYPIKEGELSSLKRPIEINLEGDLRPAVDITVIPTEDQPAEDLVFTWTALFYNEKMLKIKLEFLNPEFISQVDPNQIFVQIWDSSLFVRKSDSLPIPSKTNLSEDLPLMANPALAAAAKAIGGVAGSSGQGFQALAFLMTFCTSYGANFILG